MGLLQEVATRIVAHLRARTAGLHPIQTVLDRDRACQQAAVDAVNRKLGAGHALQLEDAVRVRALLEPYQCAEGSMRWGEQWLYPSTDLLMYLNRIYPHGHNGEDAPFSWEMAILVLVEAQGHQLPVEIAPLLPAWTQPRGQTLWLAPAAKQLGLAPRKWAQDYLRQFKEPHPDLGQRCWRIPVTAETTSIAEVLAHLVVVASKQRFFVSTDDQQRALQWVCHIVQEGVRRLDASASRLTSQDVMGDVFQALVTRFDFPATPWALQDFIRETARGIVLDEKKTHRPGTFQEPWDDPASGERQYPDAWVAEDIQKSIRTVKRWKADNGITTEGLSETQLTVLKGKYEPKEQRRLLWERGKRCGMSDEGLKKLFQRKKKSDGTPDWEVIKSHITRREKKAEAMALPEEALSAEEQRAVWEARLAEATPGSDEWCEAQDALTRLQRLSEGS